MLEYYAKSGWDNTALAKKWGSCVMPTRPTLCEFHTESTSTADIIDGGDYVNEQAKESVIICKRSAQF